MATLSKKTILITGANSGIGFETAKLFQTEGYKVIITGRREQAVKDAISSLGAGVTGVVSDAEKMKDIQALAGRVRELSETIDTLFVNAGVFKLASFTDTTEEIFNENMDVNFKGAFFTIQKLLPLIPDGGNIILNASIVAHIGLEGSSTYSAAKAAVLSLTKTLAVELASRRIRVNCISPGPINTPIYSKAGLPEAVLQAFAAGVQGKIPLKRFGGAEEVARAALFLANSANSGFVTGIELVVDGGKSITF
jgi:NAD(P)-dependent dehydrogenase (short-subunit alcohol dehydrogenase family)